MASSISLTPADAVSRLVAHIFAMESATEQRIAIGIAGGPGVGKSTLAAQLVVMLVAMKSASAALVPMDGFHMKQLKLEQLGTVRDKGAAHTFDGTAFVDFLSQLKRAKETISGPGYSRQIEDVVDNAFSVPPEVRVLVVEGNYLLLPTPPWAGVKPLLDYAVFIDVDRDLVRERLLKRHAEAGLFSAERNREHIERVDLTNYDQVRQSRDRADLVIDLITPN